MATGEQMASLASCVGDGHDLCLSPGRGELGHVDHAAAADGDHEVRPEAIDRLDDRGHRCLAVGGDDAGVDLVADAARVLVDDRPVAGRRASAAVDDEQAMVALDEVAQCLHDRVGTAHHAHQARDADGAVRCHRDAHRGSPASSEAATCTARW